MARNKTPSKVLEMKGAYKKNPQRRRDGEPIVNEPIGEAPGNLNKKMEECWDEIIRCAPDAVLTRADRLSVEMAAVLLAKFRDDPYEFSSADMTRLQSLLARFGMTPSDRAGMNIKKPDEDKNPFDEL